MPEIILFILVLVVGIASGFVGSMVGGGGLISIPFLIFLGFPPQIAIATDRMGVVGLSLGAIPKFWKEKRILWKYVPLFVAISLIGAYLGANILLSVDQKILSRLVGIILLAFLPLLFIKRDIGLRRIREAKSKKLVGYLIYFLIMIFAGFFGGGAGTLVFYTLMLFFGFTVIEASATGIVPWLPLSLLSLSIFALNGIVDYRNGIVLFVGMAVGGHLGASTAIKKGNRWIKNLFGIVVIISGIKLLFF